MASLEKSSQGLGKKEEEELVTLEKLVKDGKASGAELARFKEPEKKRSIPKEKVEKKASRPKA